jgi:beta-glucosidase
VRKIPAGESVTVKVDLCRKDVMNWNTTIQDWEVTGYEKKVWVAASSRKLLLQGELV